MQEVSAICERVIIINKGHIVADDKESSIVSISQDAVLSLFVEFTKPQDLNILKAMDKVVSVTQEGESSYAINSSEDIREQVFRMAVASGQVIWTMKQQERSMEDVFRSLTK
jgi:ABC-2 type transport system ATP-binding protein